MVLFVDLLFVNIQRSIASVRGVLFLRIGAGLPGISAPSDGILRNHTIDQTISFVVVVRHCDRFSEELLAFELHIFLKCGIQDANAYASVLTIFQLYFVFLPQL